MRTLISLLLALNGCSTPATTPLPFVRRSEKLALQTRSRILFCTDNSECDAPERCDCPFLGLLFCCEVPGYPAPTPYPIPIPIPVGA
jgi:hypothetical protein